MIPITGQIIRAGLGEPLFSGPHRILAVSTTNDAVWLIALPRGTPLKRTKKHYMLGPRRYGLGEISGAIGRGQLVMEDVPLPGLWLMTDADYLRDAVNENERRFLRSSAPPHDKVMHGPALRTSERRGTRCDHGRQGAWRECSAARTDAGSLTQHYFAGAGAQWASGTVRAASAGSTEVGL